MNRTVFPLGLLAAAFLSLSHPLPAHAQAQPIRTFVALTGSDANPCTFASPCKSVQHAHDVVAAGGEIRMLDPGSYGLLTITKAISILGDGHGGMAASGNAIAVTIKAGPTDKIALRGLVIEGFGTGAEGIKLTSGASLVVQDCVIRNFTTIGIDFSPTVASSVSISRTLVTDAGTGIQVTPTAASVTGILDHVESYNNRGRGISIFANTAPVNVTVSDSAVAGNGQYGIGSTTNATGASFVMVRNIAIANNGIGMLAFGNIATLRVTRSTITGNATGLSAQNGATLVSYGDNDLDGNTTDGVPTTTTGYH